MHAFSITQTSRNRCASHRLHLCRVMARPAQCVPYCMQDDNPPAPLRPRHTLNIRCFRIAKCMRNNCTIRATTKPEIPQRQTARNSTQSSQVTSTSPSSRLLVSCTRLAGARGASALVDGVTASRHGLRELVLRDRVTASVSRREDLEEPRGDKHRAIRDSGLLEY